MNEYIIILCDYFFAHNKLFRLLRNTLCIPNYELERQLEKVRPEIIKLGDENA